MNLTPNKKYIISCYGEDPFEAKYIKEERGFLIFEKDGIQIAVRVQYVKVLSEV